jgi:hypothetical protein
MKSSGPVRTSITILCIACLLGPVPGTAQQSPGAGSPSPGQGITGGTAPIEATLFAYRALASDVDSVSIEIVRLANDNKVVLGTAADVAAFTQWRSIMGEALLLNRRVGHLVSDLEQPAMTTFNPMPLPSPTLKVVVSPLGTFTENKPGSFLVVVTNTSTTSPTTAAVTVTWAATTQFQFASIANQSAAAATGWTCDKTAPSCSRSDPLPPGASYSALTVTVNVPQTPEPPLSKASFGAATVTGGGAPSDSESPNSIPDILRPTVTTLSGVPTTVPAGGTVAKVTVNVSAQDGLSAPPSGAVSIVSNTGVPLGTGTVIIGTATPISFPGGTYTVTATYPGDGGLLLSSSASQVVNPPSQGGKPGPKEPPKPQAAPGGAAETSPGAGGAAPAAGGALSAVTGAFSPFIALGTFLASAFAVTQTLTPTQGTMTDTPLINMVARQLQSRGLQVFVPSVYPPNLMRNGNLNDTYLWQELAHLEKGRIELWKAVAVASGNLAKANYVVATPAKYSAADLNAALVYQGNAQSLITAAQTMATSIDTFETSLFGGQSASSNQSQNGNNGNGNNGNNGNNGTANNGTANNGTANNGNGNNATGNNPSNPNGNANNNGGNNNNQNQQSPINQQSVAAILPQILAADLLAHALWDYDYSWMALSKDDWKTPGDAREKFLSKTDRVKFLMVHALESGGSQLNKSNLFYGTHIFFSGGAVMTFALFAVPGEIQCSGVAYNYEGNVREKNYDRALRLPMLPAILSTDFPCESEIAGDGGNITLGMAADDVVKALGPPAAVVDVKGTTATYKFGSLTIMFRDGKVAKIKR